MPRRKTAFESGVNYHLYNRGVNRQRIFPKPENFSYFLLKVESYLLPVMNILAYCLMPNHYHLVICIKSTSEVGGTSEVADQQENRTSEVSRAMMRLSVSYTKFINYHYDRVGPLFQGAFQAKIVHSDAYLGQLIDYLHLNPVATGLVEDPGDWPYSSYRLQADLRGTDNLRGWGDLGGPLPLTRL